MTWTSIVKKALNYIFNRRVLEIKSLIKDGKVKFSIKTGKDGVWKEYELHQIAELITQIKLHFKTKYSWREEYNTMNKRWISLLERFKITKLPPCTTGSDHRSENA